jgi:hypothetical protein
MPDGTTYLFVIEAHDACWTIRRDDHVVATGRSDHRGIDRGMRLFTSLIRAEQRPLVLPDAPAAPARPTAPAPPPRPGAADGGAA